MGSNYVLRNKAYLYPDAISKIVFTYIQYKNNLFSPFIAYLPIKP